ncbi:hypothetical protein EDE15_0236 [Edaphobacter aggregans]|uniref:DUF2306 domain-containing protein n=2 Tax=Edaphobacter aggregans TaxID=570835 RepID=A0A3R9P6U3_9BACT|nr:hypothetical protein EDE15_0236 [Edaphobacter aggregans]
MERTPFRACDIQFAIMGHAELNHTATQSEEARVPTPLNAIALLVSLLAGIVVFLPFALNTSPLNAVMLRVPGNQGNWWHALIGAPFFLAFPMIWLRLRAFFSSQLSTPAERRIIWIAVSLSIFGTILVEAPFLLHLAGTSAWQRLAVLSLGLGIVIASATILFLRRRHISPTRACLVGLNTAYLGNAALCLIVYSSATGPIHSRSGWLVTMVIVWPMILEILWIFTRPSKTQTLVVVDR